MGIPGAYTRLSCKGVALLSALNHSFTLKLSEIRHRYIQMAALLHSSIDLSWLAPWLWGCHVWCKLNCSASGLEAKSVREEPGSYFFKTFLNNLAACHQVPMPKGWPFSELSALLTSLWKLVLWKTDNSHTVLITVGKSMLETVF